MDLKGNIIRIFSANFLTMLSSIIIGFLIPSILSVESYSLVKTYTFYLSYIGLFHLGYIDGMYIKYGGKEINEINLSDYKLEHHIFIIFQLVITLIVIILSIFMKDTIVAFTAISILPINIYSFYKLFYQATGQFDSYVKCSYIYTLLYLIFNIILALCFKSQNYIFYCLTNLVSNVLVCIFLEYKFLKETKSVKINFSWHPLLNIKTGIFILIGNLSVTLFYALDRWFIKLFLDINQFGYYSFAMSMLNIINILVSAISVTFYNYLSKEEDYTKIKKIKKYFIILGSFSSLGYFVLSAIVNIYLKKYIPSLSIISISFAAYPYMMVINTLYVNLYKSRNSEKRYMLVVFMMVLISLVYNLLAIILFRTSEAIAVATTLSFITWYFYSMKDFRYITSSKKEIIYLIVSLIAFILSSHKLSWFMGGIVYLIILLVLVSLIYRKDVVNIIHEVKYLIKGRK